MCRYNLLIYIYWTTAKTVKFVKHKFPIYTYIHIIKVKKKIKKLLTEITKSSAKA